MRPEKILNPTFRLVIYSLSHIWVYEIRKLSCGSPVLLTVQIVLWTWFHAFELVKCVFKVYLPGASLCDFVSSRLFPLPTHRQLWAGVIHFFRFYVTVITDLRPKFAGKLKGLSLP